MSANTLAVAGAGNMGSGIAQKIATEGFDVTLVDVDEERVARGLASIDRTLAEAVDRRVMTQANAAAARARVHGTTRLEDVAEADLVIEAVFEDRALKQDVFRRLAFPSPFTRPRPREDTDLGAGRTAMSGKALSNAESNTHSMGHWPSILATGQCCRRCCRWRQG